MLHRTRSRPGMGGVVNLILGGPDCLLWTPAAAITRLERIAAIEEGGLSGRDGLRAHEARCSDRLEKNPRLRRL
jgi:hypothetical protein